MEIRVGGQPIRRLRTRKGYWLLALMTFYHGREVQREWLAGLLWPDSLESRARANLNLSITDLRKALGDEAYRLQSLNVSTLRLDLSGADCDLLAFDGLTANKGCADRERAISLCHGALLEDCYEPWVLAEREQREQTYLMLLESLATDAADCGDWLLATHTLRVIVRRDPYRDRAHRQLMQTLHQGGDPNAALVVYQEFFHFLRQHDLRAQPDSETRQLYEQIRSRVRRLTEASPSTQPVSAPLTTAPLLAESSVPARIAPLIGREQELLQIAMALRQSRLVTLTGSGG